MLAVGVFPALKNPDKLLLCLYLFILWYNQILMFSYLIFRSSLQHWLFATVEADWLSCCSMLVLRIQICLVYCGFMKVLVNRAMWSAHGRVNTGTFLSILFLYIDFNIAIWIVEPVYSFPFFIHIASMYIAIPETFRQKNFHLP